MAAHPFTFHVDLAQALYGLAAVIMAFKGVQQHRKNKKEKQDGKDTGSDSGGV